ncbi:MAG TPA: PilZ domain-containing protein [Gemmataceae bacterium]|nr:PilZ domain-containing protein [Gemmataceae bacterium]
MSQPSADRNRRRTRRQVSKRTIKVRCHRGISGMGTNLARTLLDVSADGARLVVASPLERGQDITLSLEGVWHARPLTAQGKVCWCASLADGTYCVGIHFDKTLPYHEVQDLASAPRG